MKKKKYRIDYTQLLIEEEQDNLKEIARTHRINKALAGRRCPPADGVIRLIKQKGKNMDCIFCKIISGDIPSEKVFENEKVLAFKDINPMAPVHILIIPKEHIDGADMLSDSNADIVKDIMLAAKQIAQSFNLDNGWRVVTNVGNDGGQTVRHLHFHLLGGKKLSTELIPTQTLSIKSPNKVIWSRETDCPSPTNV